jgi:hypothetical protein
MKFRFADYAEESLKFIDAIPLNYCNSINEFAKPRLLSSSFLDIMYHERYLKGCKLRNMVFYVKKPVTLLTSIGSTRGIIDCMLSGNMDFQLNGQEKISFNEGEYNVFLMNTDQHKIYLQPGTHELQRSEYSIEIIKRLEEETSETKYWLDKYESEGSVVLNKGTTWDELYSLQNELKHTSVRNPFREEWFYLKLRELLVLTFEHNALILQKQ